MRHKSNVILCPEDILNCKTDISKSFDMIINSGCLSSLANEEVVKKYISDNKINEKKLTWRKFKTNFKFGSTRYLSQK